MSIVLQFIYKIARPFRNVAFITLFLMIGNFHQANQKSKDYATFDHDYFFSLESKVNFNPEYVSYIEDNLTRILSSRRFNGTVLLAHKGEVVYNKSMGYSNFAEKIEFAEENNIFQLASLSKQFTAIATLILYEKGKIDLDSCVNKYIDGFPYEEITVRHLLHHTSGLQNYMYLIDNFWKNDYLPDFDDMLDMFINRSVPLNFIPGRRFSYSNSGYAFLAMLVEKVSGQRFAQFVKSSIFDPLDMQHSFVFEHQTPLYEKVKTGEVVAGHDRMSRYMRVIPVDYIDGITGDKGVFSSAEDLLKWYNALENNVLISDETTQMVFDYGKLDNGRKINYGMGYRIRNSANLPMAYHHGWWRGFRNAYVKLPDNSLLVILNNTNSSINSLDKNISFLVGNSPFPLLEEKKSNENMLATNERTKKSDHQSSVN
ncbi:MAG: serine hydrolase domain-containing protein [Bacteroidales bacterium]